MKVGTMIGQTIRTRFTTFLSLLSIALFSLLLTGCGGVKISDYDQTTPEFDFLEYFSGKTKAYGQFANRSGKIIRRFEVDITGTVKGNTLTLDERFIYDDGEKQTRIWTITKQADGQYTGTAADVIGTASGATSGFALNWKYTLDLPYKDDSIHVKFNDWMYLHNKKVMFNQAKVTKFGFQVGEVHLVFIKE